MESCLCVSRVNHVPHLPIWWLDSLTMHPPFQDELDPRYPMKVHNENQTLARMAVFGPLSCIACHGVTEFYLICQSFSDSVGDKVGWTSRFIVFHVVVSFFPPTVWSGLREGIINWFFVQLYSTVKRQILKFLLLLFTICFDFNYKLRVMYIKGVFVCIHLDETVYCISSCVMKLMNSDMNCQSFCRFGKW